MAIVTPVALYMEGGSVPVLLVTHEIKNHYPPAARAILPVEIAK